MKKIIRWIPTLITICCWLITISLTSCDLCGESEKYKIYDLNGNLYFTKEYKTEGNCIVFTDCDCSEEVNGAKTKLCGSYTITELK